MNAHRRAARWLSGPEVWNRRRLQILLGVAAVVVAAVVAGVIWSAFELLGNGHQQDGDMTPAANGGVPPDAADFTIDDARPGPLAAGSIGTIRLPQPASLGEAQVGTGLPRTPEGALAQLIAIDRRAIESASVITAEDVIESWAAPGGPTPASWSGTVALRTLLESAGLPANGASELAIRLEPAMGLVQASDGDTATVCVDFVLTAAVRDGAPDRIATADCQHMSWAGDRWVIAAGPEAHPSPSLWPGTQASYHAGYQWLEVGS